MCVRVVDCCFFCKLSHRNILSLIQVTEVINNKSEYISYFSICVVILKIVLSQ